MVKIVLTFDDNKWNHYTTVFPLLKKYNIKATFAYITQGTYTNVKSNNDAIKEMLDYGIEIASHSHSHIKFDENINSSEFLKNDLIINKKILNSHNINSYGLILPFSQINLNITFFDFLNLEYITYETSTIRNYHPYPEAKVLELTNENNLTKHNIRRIEFPLDSDPSNYLSKFYYLISNLKEDDICVVMFHNITNEANKPYNVRINIFEQFLKFLIENNYNIVTLKSLYL